MTPQFLARRRASSTVTLKVEKNEGSLKRLQRHTRSFATASLSGSQQVSGGLVVEFKKSAHGTSFDAQVAVCASAVPITTRATATAIIINFAVAMLSSNSTVFASLLDCM